MVLWRTDEQGNGTQKGGRVNPHSQETRDGFLIQYREQVIPVYRYHLIRSGDWQEAQAWTVETFRLARRWFSKIPMAEFKLWLFRIAVSIHSSFRKPPVFSESFFSPSQDQLAGLAQVAELYESWRKLPQKQQDAMALYLFAALDTTEVADVIGWNFETTLERLSYTAARDNNLRLLAADLYPVGYFIDQLEAELRQEQPLPREKWLSWGPGWLWMQYRVGPAFMLLVQISITLILFLLFILGIGAFSGGN